MNWLAVTRNMSKDKMIDLKDKRKEIEQKRKEINKKMKRFSLNLDSTIRIMQKLKVKLLLQKFNIGEK